MGLSECGVLSLQTTTGKGELFQGIAVLRYFVLSPNNGNVLIKYSVSHAPEAPRIPFSPLWHNSLFVTPLCNNTQCIQQHRHDTHLLRADVCECVCAVCCCPTSAPLVAAMLRRQRNSTKLSANILFFFPIPIHLCVSEWHNKKVV